MTDTRLSRLSRRPTRRDPRAGMAIALVLGALALMGAIFGALLFSSRHEVSYIEQAYRRTKAQYIAEAGAALAAASLFDGKFEERFYKGEREGKHGYVGHLEGEFDGGRFYVVCEDIANEMKDPKKEFSRATYNRTDLFARGTFKNASVVVYKALIRHPEERVYEWKTRDVEQDGKKLTETYDIRVR